MIRAILIFSVLFSTSVFASQVSTMRSIFAGVTVKKSACYTRSYDPAHLAAHPKQTVREIKVKLKLGTFPGYEADAQYMVGIQVKRVNENKRWTNNITCMDSDEGVRCTVDCDGGSVNLVERSTSVAGGSLILKNNGVLLYGGCGEDSEDIETIFLTAEPNGDDVFNLRQADAAVCNDVSNEAH